MLELCDRLFINIFKMYKKQGETGLPVFTSIFVLSLIQSIMVTFVQFMLFSFIEGVSFDFLLPVLVITSILGLIYNYVRIYAIVGVDNLIKRYCCKKKEATAS